MVLKLRKKAGQPVSLQPRHPVMLFGLYGPKHSVLPVQPAKVYLGMLSRVFTLPSKTIDVCMRMPLNRICMCVYVCVHMCVRACACVCMCMCMACMCAPLACRHVVHANALVRVSLCACVCIVHGCKCNVCACLGVGCKAAGADAGLSVRVLSASARTHDVLGEDRCAYAPLQRTMVAVCLLADNSTGMSVAGIT